MKNLKSIHYFPLQRRINDFKSRYRKRFIDSFYRKEIIISIKTWYNSKLVITRYKLPIKNRIYEKH